MRRLWFSLLMIIFLALAALANVQYLDYLTSSLSNTLKQAQSSAEKGLTEQAYEETLQARETFMRHSFYLHITLNHQDIDLVQSAFGQALECLRLGESGSVYAITNSDLLIKLQLLTESEQLTLKNIL